MISLWEICSFLEAILCFFIEGVSIILKLALKLTLIVINTLYHDIVTEKLIASWKADCIPEKSI